MSHIFDAVMVCSGSFSDPSLPLHCFPGTVHGCLLLPVSRGWEDKGQKFLRENASFLFLLLLFKPPGMNSNTSLCFSSFDFAGPGHFRANFQGRMV